MNQISSYELALNFALQTNKNIFLTGKAGTGKTTFLHNLKKVTSKQVAIVAPTGVAAINAGGVTLHSFFQLPLNPFIPTAEGRKHLIETSKMRTFKRRILQELELLIIDEISMVRADVLDAIDAVLRHVRYNHREPFGGVQVILIGDMFQLSPVAKDDEWQLLSTYYRSPYFFDSHVIQEKHPVYIELDKIYRQSDKSFIHILNEVRNNQLSDASMQVLKSRYNPGFQPKDDDGYITLTTHNYKADQINAEELAQLKGNPFVLKAKVEGDFHEKNYPTEKELYLKIGAKVMLIKNDTETPRRFYNGKIGIVEAFEEGVVSVYCADDDTTIDVTPMDWENIRYSVDEKTKQIEEDIAGKFTQYPLRLAWAITIHKSQGLTFDKAIIDAGQAFASGQVYVALSRCTNLEGMVLLSQINPFSIENDKEILEHEKLRPTFDALENEFEKSRQEFRLFSLKILFDFQKSLRQLTRFIKSVQDVESSFNKETMEFLQELKVQLTELEEVGSRFSLQLDRQFGGFEFDEAFLAERIHAASTYFIEKLSVFIKTIQQSPAVTDNRDNAKMYDEGLKELFSNLTQQMYIIKKLENPFSVEQYFNIKNNFIVPDFNIKSYSKSHKPKNIKSEHPILYHRLLELRNRINDETGAPIYIIAQTRSIEEMADFLPLTEKELLKIHGFGKVKVERYGKQFLKLIEEYCVEINLTSRLFEKEE